MLDLIRKEVNNVNKYVAGKTTDEVMQDYGLTEIVKLGSNENNYAPFEGCKKVMLTEMDRVHIYPEKNFVYLKKILGQQFSLTEDNVCLGHGAGNLIETVAKTFVEPGDEVIVTKEAYHLYKEASKIMGGVVKFNSVDKDFVIDLDEILKMITQKTKIIWLCNPNNPTGTMFSKEKFDEFMNAVPKHLVVVLDEAYVEYADKDKTPDILKYINNGSNLIVIRTFSKYFGIAGQRLGFLLANKETCNIIDTVSMPFCANRMGLAMAVACLEDANAEVTEKNNMLVADRLRLEDELSKLGCDVVKSQANFILFKVPCDGDAVNEKLLHRGVIIRPAKGWGFKDYLRVTIGTTKECDIFLKELSSIISELKSQN